MENKIETPLMRLIAELNMSIEYYQECLQFEYTMIDTTKTQAIISNIKRIKESAESLLPYEREVIEKNAKDFFYWWYNQTKGTNTEEAAQQFFNKTFQTNE
jgi:aminoglycoside/choline kinase family phosphotransferase